MVGDAFRAAARAALLAVLVLPGPTPLAAEPTDGAPESGEPEIGFSLEVSVRWILVPVVVEGAKGYVQDLRREDFDLQVDGRPTAIESFEAGASGPFSLVILQDLSGSMATAGRLDHSRRAVRCLLDAARAGDELGLATFASDRTVVDVPLTERHEVIAEAVELWEGRGTTALHDAVARLPEIRRGASNPKSGALLLTDGVDNASLLPPAAAREVVAGAELPVYVLAFRGRERRSEPGRTLAAASVLRSLAASTTGSYHHVGGPVDVDAACREIVSDLRHQYVLGFRTGDGPEDTRQLTVAVDSKRLRVSHRRSYIGPLPR